MENIALTQICWQRLICGTRREVNTQFFTLVKSLCPRNLDILINLSFVSVVHIIAKEAFERGINPIIIDNTNMQGWEMRPYVAQVIVENLLMALMWPLYLL